MGLGLAFKAFFASLGSGPRAERVRAALTGELPAEPDTPRAPDDGTESRAIDSQGAGAPPEAAAIFLLSALQKEGRLVDFLLEDIDGASDADVGSAAREVHRGSREALRKYVTLGPIMPQEEGTSVELSKDVDPQKVRVIGSGTPPIKGELVHRGWQVESIEFPKFVGKAAGSRIVAPAEVESKGT